MNKYLEKIAMQTDKENPVYKKMTERKDALRAEKEAAKDAELTPHQKRILDKQRELAGRPKAEPKPSREEALKKTQEKARGILQGQKAERHAEFEQGNKYLDRAQRESHTPPNAAGQVERIQAGDSLPPLRPNQELVHFQEPQAGHIHTSQTVEGFGQRLRNALARRGTLGRVALGGAALAAAGGVGYAAGHSKAASYGVFAKNTVGDILGRTPGGAYQDFARLSSAQIHASGRGPTHMLSGLPTLSTVQRVNHGNLMSKIDGGLASAFSRMKGSTKDIPLADLYSHRGWLAHKATKEFPEVNLRKTAEEEDFQPVNPAHKGLLHEEMGIPQGEPISEEKLRHVIATTDNEHTRRRAQFALNAREWKH